MNWFQPIRARLAPNPTQGLALIVYIDRQRMKIDSYERPTLRVPAKPVQKPQPR